MNVDSELINFVVLAVKYKGLMSFSARNVITCGQKKKSVLVKVKQTAAMHFTA